MERGTKDVPGDLVHCIVPGDLLTQIDHVGQIKELDKVTRIDHVRRRPGVSAGLSLSRMVLVLPPPPSSLPLFPFSHIIHHNIVQHIQYSGNMYEVQTH